MPSLVGHFVSSSREREKRGKRDIRGDEREGQCEKKYFYVSSITSLFSSIMDTGRDLNILEEKMTLNVSTELLLKLHVR